MRRECPKVKKTSVFVDNRRTNSLSSPLAVSCEPGTTCGAKHLNRAMTARTAACPARSFDRAIAPLYRVRRLRMMHCRRNMNLPKQIPKCFELEQEIAIAKHQTRESTTFNTGTAHVDALKLNMKGTFQLFSGVKNCRISSSRLRIDLSRAQTLKPSRSTPSTASRHRLDVCVDINAGRCSREK